LFGVLCGDFPRDFLDDFLGDFPDGFPDGFLGQLVVMTLWSRLASAMVFLVVGTICALGLFGDGFAGFGRTTLVVGAIAIVVALVLAAVIARSLSRPLTQMTRAVEGLSHGEAVTMPQLWPGRRNSHGTVSPVMGWVRVLILPVAREQARGSM